MKINKQINQSYPRLILCFAGWSASPELFERLEADAETDVWIVYDYRDFSFDEELSGYQEVHLIAWSLGVWAAERIAEKPGGLPTTTATSINGTPYSIDDTNGIPKAIFLGTLDNLTADGVKRFVQRMCGNREILKQYETIPTRPLEEVSRELQNIYSLYTTTPASTSVAWTQAIISQDDRIFPTNNLRNYWSNRCPVREIEAPHYPFYLWTKWEELWK